MEINQQESRETFMTKLEHLNTIRHKTAELESVRHSLSEELSSLTSEERGLAEYRAELDLLLAEKLRHVEQLRQIHSDINMMEMVIKQSKDDCTKCESKAKSLYKDYVPLKAQLNSLREEAGMPLLENDELDNGDIDSTIKRWKPHHPKRSTDNGSHVVIPTTKSAATHNESSTYVSKSHVPPMKQCASCHQHIHRNAPICPLCKAKSRSRNPKKVKK